MPTRDLSALFGATINYPGVPSKTHPDGTTYRVPSPDAAHGARYTAQAALAMKAATGVALTEDEQALIDLDDQAEKSFYVEILGPAYDEMVTDGVAWTTMVEIARDAYMIITDNQPLADAVLAAQGEADARGNRAQRRAAAKSNRSAKPPVSGRKAGSKSSPASSATKARTRAAASTSQSAISAAESQPEAKAG